WDEARPFSRECYRIEPGPGSQIESGSSYIEQPMSDHLDPGRDNFCAVEIKFDTLEWLFLRSEGHRRAKFSWGQDGTLTSCWLVP
ncbi:MAG: pyridoxamine 5'-phosphate oxidase, partial [Hyphomicrobiales bacterium]